MRIAFRPLLIVLCASFALSVSIRAQNRPECLQPETARFFLQKILPELKNVTERLGIYKRLQKGERIEDVLSFSYELAAISLNQPLGTWNAHIKRKSIFYTYVLCPIESAGSLFALPEKDQLHVKQMSAVRPMLIKGAFYRLVIMLSVKQLTFQLTPDIVRAYKTLPPVQDTFDVSILKDIGEHKR